MTIKGIHFYSGIILTSFIGLHLLNHMTAIFGADVHIKVMEGLRCVYRKPLVEPIIMISVAVQIFSGVKLAFGLKHKQHGFYNLLQLWTGIYLAVFLLIHVGAIIVGRIILHLDTNIYFGAVGLNTFPFNLFFVPYYSFAILAVFGHIAAIHSKKMKTNLMGLHVKQQSNLILSMGMVIMGMILYGLTDGLSGLEIPIEYYKALGR